MIDFSLKTIVYTDITKKNKKIYQSTILNRLFCKFF